MGRSKRTQLIGRRRVPLWRRMLRTLRFGRSQPTAGANAILPHLIKVLAGFSKVDGHISEEDIDSSLLFLRYDYPESVQSELREIFGAALREPQDLNEMAQELAGQLTMEEKILLGVQLYVLISSAAEGDNKQLVSFYLFMTNLGVASEAIDIVYQLNTGDESIPQAEGDPTSQPLETIHIASSFPADLLLKNLSEDCSAVAFRFENLILFKNTGNVPMIVRGRRILKGEFCRLYAGQRVLIEEVVLDYNDLVFYFNAKKDVSSTRLFLTFTSDEGSTEIGRQRTKSADLEIAFGLGVSITPLKETKVRINGAKLTKGQRHDATLEDSIQLPNRREISLSDLRRRARDLGGQFRLKPNRSVYNISNNPDLLKPGDILLSPATQGEVLLTIRCNYAQKAGELEVVGSEGPISVRGVPVKGKISLKDGDVISIGTGQFLRCNFTDGIIEEQRNIIHKLEIEKISHRYDKRDTALDRISFSARRGEMICVMGPSGCGKSTLLRALGGQLKPKEGSIKLNGLDLYNNLDHLGPYVSLIPHEDAFDPLLTVVENIEFSAAVRCPHLTRAERRRRADIKLVELGLSEHRHRLAGTADSKNLSGGERKRLNAGLDLIGISDVYLFDEPTSGLSSKDSEHVLEIIRNLSQSKITFVSIHQPSPRLFHMFDKALLLDRGGKFVFFGTPAEILEYFHRAHQEQLGRGGDLPVGEPSALQPDFIFDVLETPLRDLSGDIIFEEDRRGHLVPARRFPPSFWRDRFEAYELAQQAEPTFAADEDDIVPALAKADTPSSEEKQTQEGTKGGEDGKGEGASKPVKRIPERPRRRVRDEFILFSTLFKRSFFSKLRNTSNLYTTLLVAPALALLIAGALRYSEGGEYTFASAFHIPTYIFLSLVVAMFLGLTNSADEILRDRPTLQRERNHNVRKAYYILSKLLTLGIFAFAQCAVYLLVGNGILSISGMFWLYMGWMVLTAMTGVAMGLLVSSMVPDFKTALNIIPLLLIPQIILGGALIKYEEMNRNLDFLYSIKRWMKNDQDKAGVTPPSRLKVPIICETMPLRWSYEGMILSQDKLNTLSVIQEDILELLDDFKKKYPPNVEITDEQYKYQDDLKNLLAIATSYSSDNREDVLDALETIADQIREKQLDASAVKIKPSDQSKFSSQSMFRNQKVRDLVSTAESEYVGFITDQKRRSEELKTSDEPVSEEDARYLNQSPPNVFFNPEKHYAGITVNTMIINVVVLFLFVLVIVLLLRFFLKRQLTRV